MRGSLVCIAIFCLSHVSGAPTDEEGKTFFKSYDFDNAQVITPWDPLWEDQVVFAVCEGADADKKCKVYLESTNQDKNTLQSCDLNLTYSGGYENNVAIFNAGNSKAVLAVGDGVYKIKLISVKFDGCEIKETSVEVAKKDNEFPIPFCLIHIIPHEKNYELLLRNSKLCVGGFCKVIYDYEGNVVKAATKIPAVFNDLAQIAYTNNTYIIAKNQDDLATPITNLYLVKDGEEQKNITPFASFERPFYAVTLTADENKIGLCWREVGKVSCKQIYVEGEPRAINLPFFNVLNLEKGLLQLWGDIGKKDIINVSHVDEAGKQGKTVQVDPTCSEKYDLFSKLYKNTKGQYCVSNICTDHRYIHGDNSKILITKRCFLKTELF